MVFSLMMNPKPLKSYISRIFLTVLLFILLFLGLTLWSYRTFVNFIENDQRQELVTARNYELLTGVWLNLSNRRVEAFLLGIPLSSNEEKGYLDEFIRITRDLEASLQGHPRLNGWMEIKGLIDKYLQEFERFQDALEKMSPQITKGEIPVMKFYRQLASDGLAFQSSFDTFQTEVASLWNLKGGTPQEIVSLERWKQISDALTYVDKSLGTYLLLVHSPATSTNRKLILQLEEIINRLKIRMDFITSMLTDIDDLATSSAELAVHHQFKARFIPLNRRLNAIVKDLVGEHMQSEDLDDFHARMRELRTQGILLCNREANSIWDDIQLDTQRLLQQIHEKFILRIGVLLVSFLFALGSLAILPSRISRPLETLRERFTALIPGEPVKAMAVSEIQEINDLEASFCGMVDRVNAGVKLHLRYFATIERIWDMVGSLEAKHVKGQSDLADMVRTGVDVILQFLGKQIQQVSAAALLESREGSPWMLGTPYHGGELESTDELIRLREILNRMRDGKDSDGFFARLMNSPDVGIQLTKESKPGLPETHTLPSLRSVLGRGEADHFPCPGSCLVIQLRVNTPSVLESENLGLFLYFHQEGLVLTEADRMFVGIIALQIISFFETVQFIALSRKEQHLSQQLAIAKGIQEAAIPRTVPPHPLLAIDSIIIMASAVGGDFYDFFPLDDGKYALAIADVSGKNIPAALLTMALKTSLKALPIQELEPVEVLEKLNQLLQRSISEDHFVTMLFCKLDPSGQTLQIANAGHMPGVILRKSLEGEPREVIHLEIPSVPLLLGLNSGEFTHTEIAFRPGDSVFFYTDGVTDCRSENGMMLGGNRFMEILCALPQKSPAQELVKILERFRGKAVVIDDMAFIAVRFKEAG
jgi:HAMP domain-containing protein